jgi:hypothetical protein
MTISMAPEEAKGLLEGVLARTNWFRPRA